MQQKSKSTIKNSRVYNSASVGSNHSLLLSQLNLRSIQRKHRCIRVPKRFNVEKLISDPDCAEQYQIKIGGKFEPLLALNDDEIEIEELYEKFKAIINDATKDSVGYRTRKLVEGMSPELQNLCQRRRALRIKVLNGQNEDVYTE